LRFLILDRYLVREFVGPFFLAVGGFALIAIVNILMYLVELTVSRGVPITTTIRMLIYQLPELMVIFFPMAVLFSVMLLLVRMAKDNELTILRVSGITTARIILPILILCTLITGLALFVNERVVPWTNRVSEELYRQEITKRPPPEIVENIVFKVPPNRHFYVRKIDKSTSRMEGILIFEDTYTFPRLISAKNALWHDRMWTLMDGYMTDMNSNGQVEYYTHFAELSIHVDEAIKAYFSSTKSAKEMSSSELKSKIDSMIKGGMNTQTLEVEYYLKRAMPFACLIFGIVGIAFCLTFVRSGKDWWGVIVAICSAVLIVGLYFFMVAVFQAFAKNGTFSPFLGAWLPNIIYGVIGSGVMIFQFIRR